MGAHLPYEEIAVCDNGHRRLHIRTHLDGWIWQYVEYGNGWHHVVEYSSVPVTREEATSAARSRAAGFGFQ